MDTAIIRSAGKLITMRFLMVMVVCFGFGMPVAQADEASAHYRLARTLRSEGKLDEALKEIDMAVKLRPTYAQGHLTRGTILRRMDRLDEAVVAFDRAIELEPKSGQAYGLAGATLMRLNRTDEAIKRLTKATRLGWAIFEKQDA